jgi:hypothetical protein
MSATQTRNAIERSLMQSRLVQSVLGMPIRLYDAPVKAALWPFAVWRRWESKPAGGDYSSALEHTATLEVVCKNTGISEARKAIEAIQQWAIDAKPSNEEVNIVLLMTAYSDVFRAVDGRNFYGVIRLKIISENR